MQTPKVSIITICFNAEEFIERTIKSVIEQTYPNIEYIVIDGNSKDKTVDIIKQYHENIDYWISEPDKSHFDAMNKGLKAATGDYIWYMNAGDCINHKDILSNAMSAGEGKDMMYGLAVYVDEEGNSWEWHKKTPPLEEMSVKSFINGSVICHHAMIIKSECAVEYDIDTWKVSNDLDWQIRVMKNVKSIHYTGEVMCRYLAGGISSKNFRRILKERFDITRRHFGLFPVLFEQVKILLQAKKRGPQS